MVCGTAARVKGAVIHVIGGLGVVMAVVGLGGSTAGEFWLAALCCLVWSVSGVDAWYVGGGLVL